MKRKNLVYHEQKCVFSTRTLNILGRVVCNGEINPDPERLKPPTELSPPKDSKVQKRVLGLFSYYSEWIKYFSQKIKPLAQNTIFSLAGAALDAFNFLKVDVETSVVCCADESLLGRFFIDLKISKN